MDKGFITVSRQLRSHWLCQNSEYFKAWIFMLMIANFDDGKLLLGGKIYEVKRGQCSLSMRSWAHEFGMSVKAVNTFFKLLEKDGMIKREIIGKGKQSTTLLTIEKYDEFQGEKKRKGNAKETQGKHEGNTRGVQLNNDNNVNKENNDNNTTTSNAIPSFEEFRDHGIKKLEELGKDASKYEYALKAKYESWVEGGWTDGKGEKISRWKAKLSNTVPYLSETKTTDAKKSAPIGIYTEFESF